MKSSQPKYPKEQPQKVGEEQVHLLGKTAGCFSSLDELLMCTSGIVLQLDSLAPRTDSISLLPAAKTRLIFLTWTTELWPNCHWGQCTASERTARAEVKSLAKF